jgi:hypothetical protein
VLWALVLRATPFAVYVLMSRATAGRTRAVAGALFVAVLAVAEGLGCPVLMPLAIALGALGYFGVLALGAHQLGRVLHGGHYSRALLLALLTGAYVYLPATLVSGGPGFTIQLIGWEMMLAAYSYVVETTRPGARDAVESSLGDCVFFILVNPCLVYVERGERIGPPALRSAGLLRCALGLAALFVHYATFSWLLLLPAFAVVPLDRVRDAASGLQFAGYYLVRFTAGYAVHSGLASLQIGLMALIGHRVPERYHYPFLARDLADFWRRWNTYVGSWARRYVFVPVGLSLRRSWRRVPPVVCRAVAVLATFALIGFAHDVTLFTRDRLVLAWTTVFVFQGVMLVFSAGAASVVRALGARIASVDRVGSVALRFVLWHAIVVSLWFGIPAMSDGDVSGPLAELRQLFTRG